jgi:hypothetical protein
MKHNTKEKPMFRPSPKGESRLDKQKMNTPPMS